MAIDRMRLSPVADWLAVATAASLPWSTSATAILTVLWLLALVPTLSRDDIRIGADLPTAVALLPVALVLLGAIGMLWADVSWHDRFKGVDSFAKLATIPLFLMHFRRSERGLTVFAAYLISCVVLLVVSFVVLAIPPLAKAFLHYDYVIVKNAPTQSGEFVTCMAVMMFLAVDAVEAKRWRLVAGMAAVASGMIFNIFFVATGRTALVVLLVLLALFAWRRLGSRGRLAVAAGIVAVAAIGWVSSPYLRDRIMAIGTDLQRYEESGDISSSSERIEFYRKSIGFVREAPLIGHGTGTIASLFARAVEGKTGAAGSATTNPHNQTFAVAIQLGLLGTALLWAMWIAHLLLFRGGGLPQWIGLVIVVQNIVGSLFNSHLFDFAQGWVYVIGVGVAGGMVLKRREPRT